MYKFILIALVSGVAVVQVPDSIAQRHIEHQTILSDSLPAVNLTFTKDFHYVGYQVVNLYGNADAEQYVFAQSSGGTTQRIYWIQFEHFLPSTKLTYDYKADRIAEIGDVPFIYDVRGYSDYVAANSDDARSDGAAIVRLLADHNLVLPKKASRLRLICLPTADRRTEMMIIYAQSLPDSIQLPPGNSIPLDDSFPNIARMVLENARKGVTVRRR